MVLYLVLTYLYCLYFNRFEFYLFGQLFPAQCVQHLYGFSKNKFNHCKAILVKSSGAKRFDADVTDLLNSPHHLANQPSNRFVNQVDTRPLIHEWLAINLVGLLDHSPFNDKMYVPCFLKPKEMLVDCRRYLKVKITNNLNFILTYYYRTCTFQTDNFQQLIHFIVQFQQNTPL